ncbi:hypothetical protein HAX54_003311 [Datura stramonium]|uniref:Uncharacterized protein n=1 Tax=Datura stramonium TaxID=4076 RepID=A0ABS8WWN5_DATST|nr:hypothetical protein [Datura stramonium]
MKRGEKRQRLHEGLLRMLYPPPPSPPSQEENDDEPFQILGQGLNLDQIPGEQEDDRGSTSSDDRESDHRPEKLTRAQRKRIRRNKLKEAASRRQNIIGPLLPTEESDDKSVNVSTTDEEPQGVRESANEPDWL